MPIVMVCKQCKTVNYDVSQDRCTYCGSKFVEAKYVNQEQILLVGKKREILK